MKEIVKRALEHRRKTAIHGTLVVDEILEYTSDEDTVLGDCMTYLVGAFHNVGNGETPIFCDMFSQFVSQKLHIHLDNFYPGCAIKDIADEPILEYHFPL